MFSGIREHISPTILAVATILVTLSIMLLTTLELLRRVPSDCAVRVLNSGENDENRNRRKLIINRTLLYH